MPVVGNTRLGELAEICTPIILKGDIIGIIGLVAFTEEQRHIILYKRESMTVFVEKDGRSASLQRLISRRRLENVEVFQRRDVDRFLKQRTKAYLHSIRKGYVKHCNNRAAELFGTNKGDLIGKTYKQA